jgi:glycosyltransferase involved in cell wall biosynthesis
VGSERTPSPSESRPPRVAYVTTYDAADVAHWSGLGHYIGRALEGAGAEMDYIGGLARRPFLMPWAKRIGYRLVRRRYDVDRHPGVALNYARQVSRRVSRHADVVFSPGTIPIALLETAKPKAFYTDATFASMLGFHERFSDLCRETVEHGHALERIALRSSALAIYSSEWAARSAIEVYGADPGRVHVVPFGANLEREPNPEDVRRMISSRPGDRCELLFLGVDWHRKGGDVAMEVARLLNAHGLKTTLHVAGVEEMPAVDPPSWLVHHGFLSKRTEEGRRRIATLLAGAHFLLLPTRADCTPVVFSEANAYGVPCIASAVGGIPSVIREGINGVALPADSAPEAYARSIEACLADPAAYRALALSAFDEYRSRLNWRAAGKALLTLMRQL